MKFILAGTTYDAAAIDRLTLGDLIRLEKETTEMGRPMKWSELRGIIQHFMDEFDQDEHFDPEEDDLFPWFLGLMIWATLRDAGQAIPFGEAVDIPIGEIEVVDDEKVKKPQDRKPKAGGAKDPRRPRAASARGGAGRTAASSRKRSPAASGTK